VSTRAHRARTILLAAAGALALVALTAPEARPEPAPFREPAKIFTEPSPAALTGVKLGTLPAAKLRTEARRTAGEAATAVVGDRRIWPALDAKGGRLYVKYYTLRAIGTHIEVWVASDQDSVSTGLEFPPGDCRNDDRVEITDAQAQSLAQQFDGTIYPREAEAFSVPQPRDGSRATLPRSAGFAGDYYVGDGNRVVALVDNIRDEGFYDVNIRVGIGGVFIPQLDEQVDRNVITIDGVDWLHRTGANPPHNPVPGDFCRSRAARPFLIEATFAHEYQHLLESFQDSNELSWVNEGLSMFAEQLTGYSDARQPITSVGFSGSVQCFLGYSTRQTDANPNPSAGGPENSLTVWGDKGDGEIVCDYGAAETFMHYLAGRFGLSFISALHRDPDNGLVAVRKLAARNRSSGAEVLHDWSAMITLDGVLDRGYKLSGGTAARYRTPTLDASVDWASPEAYRAAGAPPNGSDYVRLRNAGGKFLASSAIRSISFDGSAGFPRRGVEWRVEPSPIDHAGNPALHSGSGGGLDRGIVRTVTVPNSGATLSFATRFDMSPGLDFGFVQVSTNGGKSWRSVGGNLTTSTADPSLTPAARTALPGLTGKSGGGTFPAWTTATYDLSAYRGKSVLLAFRYISDPRVTFPGWWIDDVKLGSTLLTDGSSLTGWRSFSQVSSEPVTGFTVQLIGYSGTPGKRAFVQRLKLDGRLRGKLEGAALKKLLAPGYEVVAAIVTLDDPAESKTAYAPYVLRVNGVVQPGGRR
jgi:Immune inhibitor A-like, MAM domain